MATSRPTRTLAKKANCSSLIKNFLFDFDTDSNGHPINNGKATAETGEFGTTLKLHCAVHISGISVVSSIAIPETVSLSSFQFRVLHNTNHRTNTNSAVAEMDAQSRTIQIFPVKLGYHTLTHSVSMTFENITIGLNHVEAYCRKLDYTGYFPLQSILI